MNQITNTTIKFLKRFEESLGDNMPNKEQCERLIDAIENSVYELNRNEKILIICDLKHLIRKHEIK